MEIAAAGILSKARYAAKFSSWSLHVLQDIDSIFSKHYRRLFSLLPGFATELLYAPKAMGGHGLIRFSDAVNTEKHSLMHKSLDSKGATRQAMLGLLHRARRVAGGATHPGVASPIPLFTDSTRPTRDNSLWASSLVEWLGLAGLSLSTGGSPMHGTIHETLPHLVQRHHLNITHADLSTLRAVGLNTIGDLLTPSTNPPQSFLRHDNLPLLAHFPETLLDPPFPIQAPILAPQQCWCVHPYTEVLEPLGWVVPSEPSLHPTHISFRRWTRPPSFRPSPRLNLQRYPTSPIHHQGTLLHLDRNTFSLGAGTLISAPFEALFPPQSRPYPVFQLILSPDIRLSRHQGVARTVVHSFISSWPHPFPLPCSQIHSTPLRYNLQQHQDILLLHHYGASS